MRRLALLVMAAAAAAALAVNCGATSSKPPPAGADAAAAGEDAAPVAQVDTGVAEGPDAAVGEDAQDPGLQHKDASQPYPPGPFGTSVGDTIENIKLYGYPEGQDTLPAVGWTLVSLAQFYDPAGNKGPGGIGLKALWVDVSARWCTFCKKEALTFNDRCAQYAAKGLACYTTLFQNEAGGEATRDDINFWMTTYGLQFAVTVDPAIRWGSYFNYSVGTPLNMFIDLKTMKIAGMCLGDDEQCISDSLDSFTRCPSAVCPDNKQCSAQGVCE